MVVRINVKIHDLKVIDTLQQHYRSQHCFFWLKENIPHLKRVKCGLPSSLFCLNSISSTSQSEFKAQHYIFLGKIDPWVKHNILREISTYRESEGSEGEICEECGWMLSYSSVKGQVNGFYFAVHSTGFVFNDIGNITVTLRIFCYIVRTWVNNVSELFYYSTDVFI